MVTVQAPGKLLLSGEWSILEEGTQCIVLAVDSTSIAKIMENKNNSIGSNRFGIRKTPFEFDGKQLSLPKATPKQKEILRFVKSAAEK